MPDFNTYFEETPAAFFKNKIQEIFSNCLSQPNSGLEQDGVAFSNFISEVNSFLNSQNQTPIVLTNNHRPSDAELANLREFIGDLNYSQSPVNLGEQTLDHIEDKEYGSQLAQFYESVNTLLEAYNVPIQSYGQDIHPIADKRANAQSKLWELPSGASAKETNLIDTSNMNLIVFGGIAAFHNNERVIEGLINFAQNKFGGKEYIEENQIKISCATYPIAHRAYYQAEIHRQNANIDHYSSDNAKDFIDRTLLPSLGISYDSKPDTSEILPKLQNIRFFTYSYGCNFLSQITNYFTQRLEELGYSGSDISSMINQMFALQIGPTVQLSNPSLPQQVPSMYVMSERDLRIRSKTNNHKIIISNGDQDQTRLSPFHSIFRMGLPPDENTTVYNADRSTKVVNNCSGHEILCYMSECSVGEQHYSPKVPINALMQSIGKHEKALEATSLPATEVKK